MMATTLEGQRYYNHLATLGPELYERAALLLPDGFVTWLTEGPNGEQLTRVAVPRQDVPTAIAAATLRATDATAAGFIDWQLSIIEQVVGPAIVIPWSRRPRTRSTLAGVTALSWRGASSVRFISLLDNERLSAAVTS